MKLHDYRDIPAFDFSPVLDGAARLHRHIRVIFGEPRVRVRLRFRLRVGRRLLRVNLRLEGDRLEMGEVRQEVRQVGGIGQLAPVGKGDAHAQVLLLICVKTEDAEQEADTLIARQRLEGMQGDRRHPFRLPKASVFPRKLDGGKDTAEGCRRPLDLRLLAEVQGKYKGNHQAVHPEGKVHRIARSHADCGIGSKQVIGGNQQAVGGGIDRGHAVGQGDALRLVVSEERIIIRRE